MIEAIERGNRARRALEEFLDPAFEAVISAYTARIEEVAASKPWEAQKITSLANAARIAKSVKAQIEAIVYEGERSRTERERTQEIEQLSPAKRRLLNIGI
jgi:hypothetical protein